MGEDKKRPFKKTKIQRQASKILSGIARFIMLFGGSRSGKTFILIYSVIVRASKVKSRHLVLRHKFNHIKTSIWLDTLPKVLYLCFPDLHIEWNKTDYFITLPNGSEIWFAGLDDSVRVEKILGKEYSTIYFNECSQIPYSSVKVALTRLAEKNSLKKKVYFDENPPSKKHWSYWLFVRKQDPDDNEPVKEELYDSFLMNPKDNIENIDEDYIRITLASMSKKDRDRFEHGKFDDSGDGLTYYGFDRDVNVKKFNYKKVLKQNIHTIFIGQDYNVDPMTCALGFFVNDTLFIFDEIFERNSDTPKVARLLNEMGYHAGKVIPDSTGKNRKTSGKTDFQEMRNAGFTIMKTQNPFVKDRVNNLNRCFEHQKIVIHPRCKKLINDLDKVCWNENNDLDQKGPNKLLTHISDCLGYMAWKLLPPPNKDDCVTITRR